MKADEHGYGLYQITCTSGKNQMFSQLAILTTLPGN